GARGPRRRPRARAGRRRRQRALRHGRALLQPRRVLPVSDVALASVVIIGAGGIGAPLAMALVGGGVRRITVVDDDTVDVSTLHRQIRSTAADVGRSKLDAFAEAVERLASGVVVTPVPGRALPSTVATLIAGASVGADATPHLPS